MATPRVTRRRRTNTLDTTPKSERDHVGETRNAMGRARECVCVLHTCFGARDRAAADVATVVCLNGDGDGDARPRCTEGAPPSRLYYSVELLFLINSDDYNNDETGRPRSGTFVPRRFHVCIR